MRELNELEVRKHYQNEITERIEAAEYLRYVEDINRTWENIKGYIKISTKQSIGLHELKQHKPWLDEERSDFRSKERG